MSLILSVGGAGQYSPKFASLGPLNMSHDRADVLSNVLQHLNMYIVQHRNTPLL